MLYRTKLAGQKSGKLVITELHDYANVLLDSTLVGTLDRRLGEKTIILPATGSPTPVLDILVEGMGHISYAQEMIDRKGITERVSLSGMTLMNWHVFLLPLRDAWVTALPAGKAGTPPGVFFRGSFTLERPADTFLDVTGYRKGVVWVSGHNLGRYWDVGLQKRLYCPAPLAPGRRERGDRLRPPPNRPLATNSASTFAGPVTMLSYGKAQYQWHPARKDGFADPDEPPVKSTLSGSSDALYAATGVDQRAARPGREVEPDQAQRLTSMTLKEAFMGSGRRSGVTGICLAIAMFFFIATAAMAESIVVDAAPSHVANVFSPPRALGGAIDRLRPGTGAPSTEDRRPTKEEIEKNTDALLSDPVLKEILGAGWQTVTYRQNTELMVEAWHWNARGRWSNAEEQEGYFTGSAEPTEPIRHSWAYPLPHRGFSRGDGNGWSRLTDGDLKSYWKSNPYLTKPFTGEDDALHPQWVMVDLGRKVDVNAIRIAWADPYARRYAVQFWTGEIEPFYGGTTKGTWQTFPQGSVTEGRGGTVTLKLVSWKIPVQYVRIWMTESSNTCDTHGSADRRNCLGYAINELYAGTLSADGEFSDVVKHLPSREQTITWPSSVDPWHAASDLDYSRGDQIGFDLFFASGITRGLPTMVPIAMLYATPEDAAAEIAYLYRRDYPVNWIEMGEEADGQHMLPEDYGALYLQFATAIHRLVPQAKLGGPAFEGTFEDVEVWPDAAGKVSWIGRFFDYLKAHGRMNDFMFFSFEHYPFQDRKTPPAWSDLYLEPGFVSHIIQVWKDNGLPPNVPFFMTEGNMGGGSGPTDVKSGLWLADYVGSMMTGGASGTYYFHYMPSPGGRGGFLRLDRDYHVIGYPPQYLAAQVITKEWVQPVDAPHRIFDVSSDVRDAAGNLLVTAYAVERPDGQWAVMLVNRDHDSDHAVKVAFADSETRRDRRFSGPVDRIVFGAAEYEWHPEGTGGHADPDGPPSKSVLTGGTDTLYPIPKASIVVLRGRIGGE